MIRYSDWIHIPDIMYRDITLMTVSGYVTNQSVFTVPLHQLREIRFFFYVYMYFVGNNTCPLNLRENDTTTETYRLMQKALGNSVIK